MYKEKIFTITITDKRLSSLLYKKYQNISKKKVNNPIENWIKDMITFTNINSH